MHDATGILQRHPDNPIITRADIPGAMCAFNPSPAMYNGKTMLVISTYMFNRNDTRSRRGTMVGESTDGIHFDIRERLFVDLDALDEPMRSLMPLGIDNRVTQIGDTYYFLTPAGLHGEGPWMILGKTTDFDTYEPIDIVTLPTNRGASLFPEKINGKYYRLDRPGARSDMATIWVSASPDLVHWGSHRPLLRPGYAIWNNRKIGPTPPIKTAEGWLVILHGVMSWEPTVHHYYIGAALLDLEDPTRIIGKTQSWLLAPEEPYEINGQVSDVVFPCGALADHAEDRLRLYYGAADTCIGLATGKLSDVIEACKKEI